MYKQEQGRGVAEALVELELEPLTWLSKPPGNPRGNRHVGDVPA
jgi:hypothetical protein